MHNPKPWHQQDRFWELFETILFDQQRQASAAAELDQLAALLNLQKGERVLDLCCGIGRHSLELARRGFDVVGVDRTQRFIEQAQQQAEEEQLEVEFLVADMKAYCRPEQFDIVFNLFGSFGYFEDPEDDQQVINNMYTSLRPGGRLLIETQGKEIAARDFRARSWSEHDDMLVLAERQPIQNWRLMQTRWIVIKGHERIEHTVQVRAYSAAELTGLLARAGFVDLQVYGDQAGRAYDHEARRLVVLGVK